MSRLFAAFGVDFDQWKALTVVLLKLDFRLSSLATRPGRAEARLAAGLFMQFMFYTLFGLMMALFVIFGRDLFLAGTIGMTITMFIVGTAVLLDHNSAIASPADYSVLGFRPISSRTYFAVRLTNVLAYTSTLTTVSAWLPIAALFYRHGAAVGLAGIAAFSACATSTALAILVAYAWMLRVVGPEAITRALSYVQLTMSFLVYGGYFVMSRIVSRSFVASVSLPATPWLLLYPGTWFASYLEIAAGRIGPMQVVPAAASVVAFAAMASGLGGRLSLDYSERLGALLTTTARSRAAPSARASGGLWFAGGEARAVALLVRSQFRNDQKFRMGVLSILPLTLMYVFMDVRDGGVGDPFARPGAHQAFSPVTMAVMMFPSILKMHLTRSDAYRASWIFFACPTDRMRIIRSSKHVLVAFFLLPYLAFLLAIFAYAAGNVLHVLVHIAFLGLVSHLVLQIAMLVDPELPFSKPLQKGRNSSALFAFMMMTAIMTGILAVFSARVYASPPATALAFGTVGLASLTVDRLTRARVERDAGSLEFEG